MLKPCPFCGGERLEVLNMLEENPEFEVVGLSKDNFNVVCQDCFGTGGTRRTYFDAVEAWNRRAENENI